MVFVVFVRLLASQIFIGLHKTTIGGILEYCIEVNACNITDMHLI